LTTLCAVGAAFVDLSQEARTLEELEMQRVERQRTTQYFKHLSALASAAAVDLQARYSQLHDDVMQQVVPGCDVVAVAGGLKDELRQLAQLSAQQLVHEEWAQKFAAYGKQAEEAFQQ
jgi:hypothetical protein